MDLTLTRDCFHPGYTTGVLRVDGRMFGYACEDVDRGLDSAMPLD